MSKQRGLGRGLGALFPGSRGTQPAANERASGTVALIGVDAIVANRYQPRRSFDASELEELAQSIRTNGILSPILVRALPENRFELVAGERRWRAAQMAGLTHVPALVRAAEDAQALEFALLENVQRTDLNVVEEAAGYRRLIDEHGFTQESLSQRIGKARPTIANALRLLSLPDAVLALVRDGSLTAGHARALAALPRERAIELAREAVAHGLTVRDLERRAGAGAPPKKAGETPKPAPSLSPDLVEIESRLRFALATRVALRPSSAGGTLEIHYAGDEELQRIVDVICPEES
jgi:ParB family transcriptional regulator, chromosome partitioning protein